MFLVSCSFCRSAYVENVGSHMCRCYSFHTSKRREHVSHIGQCFHLFWTSLFCWNWAFLIPSIETGNWSSWGRTPSPCKSQAVLCWACEHNSLWWSCGRYSVLPRDTTPQIPRLTDSFSCTLMWEKTRLPWNIMISMSFRQSHFCEEKADDPEKHVRMCVFCSCAAKIMALSAGNVTFGSISRWRFQWGKMKLLWDFWMMDGRTRSLLSVYLGHKFLFWIWFSCQTYGILFELFWTCVPTDLCFCVQHKCSHIFSESQNSLPRRPSSLFGCG